MILNHLFCNSTYFKYLIRFDIEFNLIYPFSEINYYYYAISNKYKDKFFQLIKSKIYNLFSNYIKIYIDLESNSFVDITHQINNKNNVDIRFTFHCELLIESTYNRDTIIKFVHKYNKTNRDSVYRWKRLFKPKFINILKSYKTIKNIEVTQI